MVISGSARVRCVDARDVDGVFDSLCARAADDDVGRAFDRVVVVVDAREAAERIAGRDRLGVRSSSNDAEGVDAREDSRESACEASKSHLVWLLSSTRLDWNGFGLMLLLRCYTTTRRFLSTYRALLGTLLLRFGRRFGLGFRRRLALGLRLGRRRFLLFRSLRKFGSVEFLTLRR